MFIGSPKTGGLHSVSWANHKLAGSILFPLPRELSWCSFSKGNALPPFLAGALSPGRQRQADGPCFQIGLQRKKMPPFPRAGLLCVFYWGHTRGEWRIKNPEKDAPPQPTSFHSSFCPAQER